MNRYNEEDLNIEKKEYLSIILCVTLREVLGISESRLMEIFLNIFYFLFWRMLA